MKKGKITLKDIRKLFNSIEKGSSPSLVFYKGKMYKTGSKSLLKALKEIVDDGTTVVTIATPKNWKCKRKKCTIKYLHKHTTYACLEKEIKK